MPNDITPHAVVDEHPFYKRSEFWMSLITSIIGLFLHQNGHTDIVRDIGAAGAVGGTVSYAMGRSKIKAANVQTLISTVADVLKK